MRVIERVGTRYVFVIEPVVAGLVASDQEDGGSPGIKRIEDAYGVPAALNAKLAHVRMPPAFKLVGVLYIPRYMDIISSL